MAATGTSALRRTPFYPFHQEHGARFVDFAGWEMPISYGSIIEEHKAVRSVGGMFDVSHMGRIIFRGPGARRFLERILTRRVTDMKENTCRYSLVCNERGGVLDDVLVYRYEDRWMLVVNAANRAKIIEHVERNHGDLNFEFDDQTEFTAMVACQGPKIIELIGRFSSEVPALKRYSFCVKSAVLFQMTISRTGYTGEDGVEVVMPAKASEAAVRMLLQGGGEVEQVRPTGLGARDTLRLEAGMPLYGHELDEDTDPLSAGLGFAVSLDKHEHERGEKFIGQDALQKIADTGPPRQLIGLKLEGRRTPRQGMDVLVKGKACGKVTSGCLSPTLGCPIAMAYVPAGACEVGGSAAVKIASNRVKAEVVKLPFYKRPKS